MNIFYKRRLGVMVLTLTMILSGCSLQGTRNVKKAWNKVTSFVCYYGEYDENMAEFDVAILESNNLTKEQIKKLNDSGVYTIAYLTVGEDDSLNKEDGKGPGGYASYYFDNGSRMPAEDGNWGSYYANAASPLWQKIVVEKARAIFEKGCDGLFLDTIDTVDLYPDSIPGMVELVKKLKETYPDKKIVANRGMTIMDRFAPYIDGMMYEDINSSYDFEKKVYIDYGEEELAISKEICDSINRVRADYRYPVFGLDYADPDEKETIQKYYDATWEYDFIPYVSTIYLDHVYIHGITPKSTRGARYRAIIDATGA